MSHPGPAYEVPRVADASTLSASAARSISAPKLQAEPGCGLTCSSSARPGGRPPPRAGSAEHAADCPCFTAPAQTIRVAGPSALSPSRTLRGRGRAARFRRQGLCALDRRGTRPSVRNVGTVAPVRALGIDWSQAQWGTVSEWVGGLGTVLAFFLTGWGLRREGRQFREEQVRLREMQEREQASQVFVTWERRTITSPHDNGQKTWGSSFTVEVVNRSALPVSDVNVRFVMSDSLYDRVLDQAQQPRGHAWDVVKPQPPDAEPWKATFSVLEKDKDALAAWAPEVIVEFSDAGSRRWQRDQAQRLRKLADPSDAHPVR